MHTKISTPYRYSIPEIAFVVHDAPLSSPYNNATDVQEKIGQRKMKQKKAITGSLGQYYNDVYKLLLAKLTDFDRAAVVANSDSTRLEALVRELIKVKSLLETGGQQSE